MATLRRSPGWTTRQIRTIFLLLGTFFGQVGFAQNLINSGNVNNTGTLKVKNQATGLPSSVDGTVEYFGADQNIPSVGYKNLLLSGTGTKSVSANFTVSGTITVASAVTLRMDPGVRLDLGGTLTENGYLSGIVARTDTLAGATTSSNFGGIGASISWSSTAPGITTVTRTSGIAVTGSGNQSILRYYDIAPAVGNERNSSFTFRYNDIELNGRNEASLELWRSVDGGASWRRQGGTVDTSANLLMKSNIALSGRWSASDASNPLGPSYVEWVPYRFVAAAGDTQTAETDSLLSPFVIVFNDGYGNALSNLTVRFEIDSVPAGAAGYMLSDSIVTTNASGQASAQLRLGNVAGTYRVRVTSPSLPDSVVYFRAQARTFRGVAATVAQYLGDGQQAPILTPLRVPLSVIVRDIFGDPVVGASVVFRVDSLPVGAIGWALSDTIDTTDPTGVASVNFTLGTKVGTYRIRASSPALPDSIAYFRVNALAGAAASLVYVSGSGQQDTINAALPGPLTLNVYDVGSNPVSGVQVQFAVASKPAGASGDSIISPLVSTDGLGRASTSLILGNKVGSYAVRAVVAGVNDTVIFVANAVAGAPTAFTQLSGTNQSKSVNMFLDQPFVVRITDRVLNPVAGVPVQFAILDTPATAVGHALGVTSALTDALGEARSTLKLGTKVGLYRVRVTSSAFAGTDLIFVANGLPTAAAMLAAVRDGTVGVGSRIDTLVVALVDTFANPIAGIPVQFTLLSKPPAAVGDSLLRVIDTTDAQGRATTFLRLGNVPGVYQVRATASGLDTTLRSTVQQVLIVVGDANSDGDMNIADLTMIIDHILGRKTLVGIDSMRADVNDNGAINILDAQLVINRLLTDPKNPFAIRIVSGSRELPEYPPYAGPPPQLVRIEQTPVALGEFEFTPHGVRFNLNNTAPVKGVQVIARLKRPDSTRVFKPDVVFERAKMMEVPVNVVSDTLNIVAYNFQNVPIEAGSGSIFRLPIANADTSSIEIIDVLVSVADNQAALIPSVPKTVAPPEKYPISYRLQQNYPNPFNGQTVILFEVPDIEGQLARVMVQVFNILGQKVKTLARGEHEAGRYQVTWDGTDDNGARVASGVYFYRLISLDGNFVTSKKMILLK
ncbi:MAG TPA: FlgD immunoglobulin-like domain containing protein [Bacteroidota bacterium]|nr:FlgD immunoglobulin-like domain containing protein [Bacteroidota bacterium]